LNIDGWGKIEHEGAKGDKKVEVELIYIEKTLNKHVVLKKV